MKLTILLILLTVSSCVCTPDYTEVIMDGKITKVPTELVNELPDFAPTTEDIEPKTPTEHVDEVQQTIISVLKKVSVLATIVAIGLGIVGRLRWASTAVGVVIACAMGIYGISYLKVIAVTALWTTLAVLLITLAKKYKVIEELSKHFDDTEGDKKISEEAYQEYLKHRTKGDTNDNPTLRERS